MTEEHSSLARAPRILRKRSMKRDARVATKGNQSLFQTFFFSSVRITLLFLS
jgi:hypothetical protein